MRRGGIGRVPSAQAFWELPFGCELFNKPLISIKKFISDCRTRFSSALQVDLAGLGYCQEILWHVVGGKEGTWT